MKNPKTIQDADLNKQKLNDCCSQAAVYAPEAASQQAAVKNSPDKKNDRPPYYHREIF